MSSGGSKAWTARRAIALLAAATAAAFALLALGGPVDRAAAACANADATIVQATAKQLRNALTCVINNKRENRDRKEVDKNGKLQEAAKRHNETMLEEDCWDHKCPGEPRLGKRIKRTGYLDGARRWRFAENFGCATTPKGMVDAWLGADKQRRNLLNPQFRDIGAAAAKDQVASKANCTAERVTYTVVLAVRKG